VHDDDAHGTGADATTTTTTTTEKGDKKSTPRDAQNTPTLILRRRSGPCGVRRDHATDRASDCT